MPISNLTGTTDSRMSEVENRWLITEGNSDPRFYEYSLYSVPVGQTHAATMFINTGSLSLVSGTLEIEKDIHIFEDEADADAFLTQVGIANVASISEKYGIRDDLSSYRIVEVQLINYPKSKIDLSLIDCELERGFKLEIFTSGTLGLSEVEKEVRFNANGDLVSETYLKYFEIEEDV
jgi:hypothetical protein